MAVALALSAGFILGLTANIYALGLIGSVFCAASGLILVRSQGVAHAAETTALIWLMLQLGFGAALGMRTLWARMNAAEAEPLDEAPNSALPPVSW